MADTENSVSGAVLTIVAIVALVIITFIAVQALRQQPTAPQGNDLVPDIEIETPRDETP